MGLFDMVKAIHPDSQLFGFLKGPHGVFSNNYIEIKGDYMQLYRNMGGFDMIRKIFKLILKNREEIKSRLKSNLPVPSKMSQILTSMAL